jgi:ribosomal protein L1
MSSDTKSFGKQTDGVVVLVENITVFVEAVRDARPITVEGTYIKNIVLSATMLPGIQLIVDKT